MVHRRASLPSRAQHCSAHVASLAERHLSCCGTCTHHRLCPTTWFKSRLSLKVWLLMSLQLSGKRRHMPCPDFYANATFEHCSIFASLWHFHEKFCHPPREWFTTGEINHERNKTPQTEKFYVLEECKCNWKNWKQSSKNLKRSR